MICVLCQNETGDDFMLTGDGHVCLGHIYQPDRYYIPPLRIYRWSADGSGEDITNGTPGIPPAVPGTPEPRVTLELTLAEAALVKDALALAASMRPRSTAVIDKLGKTARYWDHQLGPMLKKMNLKIMEAIGFVTL